MIGAMEKIPFSEDWYACRLSSYLVGRIRGFSRISEFIRLKGGQSNPTYRLITDAGSYVLRMKPGRSSDLLPSAHAIDREYRVMSALEKAGIPVPSVLTYCDDEEVIGRQFYLMHFVQGRVFWDQSLPSLERAERRQIYHEANRVLAALHRVDYQAIGLADFGKADNFLERQIARWSKQYRASETESIDAMERLMEWLPSHIPEHEERSVVHGDYRLDNLIFHPAEPRIIGVLDWELATLGHPFADFAYHCLGYRIAPSQFRGIAGLDLEKLGIPCEREYVDLYCKQSNRERIDHWEYYIAYNLFRLAAILQGIAHRAIQGTAADDNAAAVGRQARVLAELGWSAAISGR